MSEEVGGEKEMWKRNIVIFSIFHHHRMRFITLTRSEQKDRLWLFHKYALKRPIRDAAFLQTWPSCRSMTCHWTRLGNSLEKGKIVLFTNCACTFINVIILLLSPSLQTLPRLKKKIWIFQACDGKNFGWGSFWCCNQSGRSWYFWQKWSSHSGSQDVER